MYAAAAKWHMAPEVVDATPIWKLASAFGCANPDDDDDGPTYRGNRPSTLPKGIRKIPGNEEALMRQMAEARGG